MDNKFIPLSNNCLCKIANKTHETKSGILIAGYENINTEIWEIVALPDKVLNGYEDLKIGDHFLAWKNWKGFPVNKPLDPKDTIYCIDFLDVAAIVK